MFGFPHPNNQKGHIYVFVYCPTADDRFGMAVAIPYCHHYLQQLSSAITDIYLRFSHYVGAFYLSVYLFSYRPDRADFWCSLARRIILSVMVPALLISYLISALFYQGSWQGFPALSSFNLFVARIAAASFMAYVLGQILDVQVFNRLRQRSAWWVAPTAAMFFGNISDTMAFFFIAFYRSSDPFMAANWVEIALVDYSFKLLICMLFFLPAYGVMLNVLLKYFARKTEQQTLMQANTAEQ